MRVSLALFILMITAQICNETEKPIEVNSFLLPPPANQPVRQEMQQPEELGEKCPYCKKSDQTVPIIYGFPAPEHMKNVDQEKAVLGGCLLDKNNPQWHCKRDKTEF
jgi:hypothetical protein